MTPDQVKQSCSPVLTMGDLGDDYRKVAFDGNTTLKNEDIANPCGLIAKYMFNDTYKLYEGDKNIKIDETNIAHAVDINYKFKAPSSVSSNQIQWRDVTNGKNTN